jgi:hypothetical protein
MRRTLTAILVSVALLVSVAHANEASSNQGTPVYARSVFGAVQYTTVKPSADAVPVGHYRDVFGARQFVKASYADQQAALRRVGRLRR